jgi:hypothetical protein
MPATDGPTIRITRAGGVAPLQVEGFIGAPPNERALSFRERDGWDLSIAPPGWTVEDLWRAPEDALVGCRRRALGRAAA